MTAALETLALERGLEQIKRAPPKSLFSCLGEEILLVEPGCLGLLFRRVSDGLTLPFRCDGWSCPECAPVKGRRIARAIRLAALDMGLDTLTTLTLAGRRPARRHGTGTLIPPSPVRGDPVASRRGISEKWNALRTYLRRAPSWAWKVGLPVPRGHRYLDDYLAVPEFQKDGTAHLHLGTKGALPNELLGEAWASLGGGFTQVSNRRTMRGPEDVARELAKYLTKAIDLPDEKQGAGFTTWACKEGGGFRRRPWHRIWPSRPVGRAIRAHLEETREEDAIKPPGTGWELVTPIEGVPTTDYPQFQARKEPTIKECPGHLETASECCHAVEGLWRCLCGGPAEARPWEFESEILKIPGSETAIVDVGVVLTDQTLDSWGLTPSLPPPLRAWRPAGVGPARARQSEQGEEGRLVGKGPPGGAHET